MVKIQLVTIEGCPGVECPACLAAEVMLHRVLDVCGVRLPQHDRDSRGEHYLSDGRTIEAIHLDCGDERGRGFDPREAPFLMIDGEVVLKGATIDVEKLADAVVQALFPSGFADARP